MIEQDPGPGLHPDPLEQRLHDALRARADSVDLPDLRPAAPPTRHARFRLPAVRPVTRPVRRSVLALLMLAAVVAGLLFVAARWERETPVRPANVPSVSPTPDVTDAVPQFPEDDGVDAVPDP
ncbi:hypothetical protein ACIBCS_12060 [Streptomyces phaeochromogenes]|uniref:hypothetical protein n=1 Tax=Streptomyces phaeochromogenes TaxID=1923 RepID=UPI0033DCCCC8